MMAEGQSAWLEANGQGWRPGQSVGAYAGVLLTYLKKKIKKKRVSGTLRKCNEFLLRTRLMWTA
jgi:hypothetical protein